MYLPLATALNHALEELSGVQANGLPEFKSHIAFVPCDTGVQSGRELPGSSFKPDVALMSIQDARELHRLDRVDGPKVSRLIDEIAEKRIPCSTSWSTILSAVEVKRKSDMSGWASLRAFGQQDRKVGTIRDADQCLDRKLDDSGPTTRKINLVS